MQSLLSGNTYTGNESVCLYCFSVYNKQKNWAEWQRVSERGWPGKCHQILKILWICSNTLHHKYGILQSRITGKDQSSRRHCTKTQSREGRKKLGKRITRFDAIGIQSYASRWFWQILELSKKVIPSYLMQIVGCFFLGKQPQRPQWTSNGLQLYWRSFQSYHLRLSSFK